MKNSHGRQALSWPDLIRMVRWMICFVALTLAPAGAAEVLRFTGGDGKSFYSYSTRLDLRRDFYSMNIEGGRRPYSFSLTKPLVAISPAYPGAQVSFKVVPKAVGTTILTVQDTQGNAITRELVVFDPGAQPLALGALPDAQNPVAVGQGRSFGVSGGTKPYTVVSENPSVARIEVRTNIYMVWGVAPGVTQISVTDATGAHVQGTVHVGTAKPLIVSVDATLLRGGTGTLVISSGNPPYVVTTSPHLSATPQGTDALGRIRYLLTALAPGQGTVTVRDSKALTATKVITIQDGVSLAFPQLSGEPRTLDVGQTTRLEITGGSAPYTVTASHPKAVALQGQGAGQYTVTGLQAGVGVITVRDRSGATRGLSLIIRNPPTLTLAAPRTLTLGLPGTLSLIGGAAPISVTVSGSQLQLTKIDDKKYTLTPKGVGAVVITARDSKGTTQQHTLSIEAPVAPLKVFVSSNILKLGATGVAAIRALSIQGGVAPYTATVSGNQLRLSQVNASQFQMTPLTRGTATVTVRDSKGRTAIQSITVQ